MVIRTGSAGLQPKKKEEPGFGLNLGTGMDLGSIVFDAATGNWVSAGMGAAGLADDATGNAILGEQGSEILDKAQSVTSLGGAVKGAITGGAEELAKSGLEQGIDTALQEGVGAAANVGKIGADVAGAGVDAASAVGNTVPGSLDLLGVSEQLVSQGGQAGGELALGGGGQSLADIMKFAEAGDMGGITEMVNNPSVMNTLMSGDLGIDADSPGLKDIMKKMMEFGSKGGERSDQVLDMVELYQEMTKAPPAPGMMPSGGQGGPPQTVASQFMRR